MIKEVVQDKFRNNLKLVVDEIISYCGEEYKEKILDSLKNVDVSLVEDKGVYCDDGIEVYVGDEAVCVKGENPQIIIPLSFMGDSHGNVVLVHLLLHMIGEEPFVSDSNDAFNEVIVDYMANDIAKQLEKKRINVTVVKPNYNSNTFYSKMFSEVEEFYKQNKEKIIASRMGENVVFEDVDEYIEGAQKVVDSVFLSEEQTDFKIKRR